MSRGIFFDYDGTLVNSLALTVGATRATLRQHGYHERAAALSDADIIAGMWLPTAPRMGAHAEVSDDQTQNALSATFYSLASNLVGEFLAPYDGITELLHELAAAGHQLAVISNNQGDLVRRRRRHGLAGLLHHRHRRRRFY